MSIKDKNWILSTKQKICNLIEDFTEMRHINIEACTTYDRENEQHRLGKIDAYQEVITAMRKAFNL